MKIKSLAEEARIIRHEERKAPDPESRNSLREHRIWDVRREQRSSLLAYGYLRGQAYRQMEPKAHEPPHYQRVAKMIEKFGGGRMPPDVVREWARVDGTVE